MLIRGILKQKLFPADAYFFESEIQEILWFGAVGVMGRMQWGGGRDSAEVLPGSCS